VPPRRLTTHKLRLPCGISRNEFRTFFPQRPHSKRMQLAAPEYWAQIILFGYEILIRRPQLRNRV
jgi:hypothetical protein